MKYHRLKICKIYYMKVKKSMNRVLFDTFAYMFLNFPFLIIIEKKQHLHCKVVVISQPLLIMITIMENTCERIMHEHNRALPRPKARPRARTVDFRTRYLNRLNLQRDQAGRQEYTHREYTSSARQAIRAYVRYSGGNRVKREVNGPKDSVSKIRLN